MIAFYLYAFILYYLLNVIYYVWMSVLLVCMYVYVPCIDWCSWSEEGLRSFGVTDVYETAFYGCWELNQGPLQERPALVTICLSLQPHFLSSS